MPVRASEQSSISIHAPVKGATAVLFGHRAAVDRISIHAPVKGATEERERKIQYFKISIHAPVKGATCIYGNVGPGKLDFNPRTREGCDLVPFL